VRICGQSSLLELREPAEKRTWPRRFKKREKEVEGIAAGGGGGGGGGAGAGAGASGDEEDESSSSSETEIDEEDDDSSWSDTEEKSDEVFDVREILIPPVLVQGYYQFPCLWAGCSDDVKDFALTSDLIANCKTKLRLACAKAKINFDSQEIQDAP
jgi:hypothetical protein